MTQGPWSRRRLLTGLGALALSCVAAPLASAAPAPSHKTAVIFLKHMKASRAVAIYERVLGRVQGSVIAPGRDNTSVTVRDTAVRLARYKNLLKLLDVPGDELRVYVRPVLHRAPTELAALIEEVLVARKTKATVTLVPDNASGQLVVSTTKRVYFHIIDPLARKLDRKAPPGRRVRIVPQP